MDGTATAVKFAPGTTDSVTGKPYFYKSECGNFTVTLPLGESKVYGAWRVNRDASGRRRDPDSLGWFPTAQAAKKVCEDQHVPTP